MVATDTIPGTSLTAGRIAATHSVSHSGRFEYSLPLWVVPGRRGMQPELSIDYSSGAPTTHLGRGFSLNGESALSRCQHGFSRDGAPRAVRFDLDDAFCIDGKRLVLVSGTHGKAGAVYVTEVEDNRKAILDRVDSDGPLQWSVFDPSGLIHRYGVTANSRLESGRVAGGRGAVGNGVVSSSASHGRLRWLRETTEDRFGNGIHYAYDIIDGPLAERLLRRISYTTHDSLSAPPANRFVDFFYDVRTDNAHAFVGGFKLGQSRLLTRIEVQGPASAGAGPVYRIYKLSYTTGLTGEPLLDTFTECDQRSVCKRPLQFSWTTSADDLQAPFTDYNTHLGLFRGSGHPYGMAAWERIHAGDFTGDGADDLLVLRANNNWYVLPSSYGPHGSNEFGDERSGLFEPALTIGNSGNPNNVVFPFESYARYVDTDFDNRTDILRVAYTNGFVDPQTGVVFFEGDYQNCRNTGQASSMFVCPFSEGTPSISFLSNSYIGDFDGNGRPDLIRQLGDFTHMSTGGMLAAMSISAGVAYSFGQVGGGLLTSPMLESFVLDVDGDRRAEMVTSEVVPDPNQPGQFVSTGWFNAFNLDGAGVGHPRPMNLLTVDMLRAPSGDTCPHYLFADANGDGLEDAVVPSCTHEPDIYMNSGNGFLPAIRASSNLAGVVAPPRYTNLQSSFDDGIRVIDVNRDGRQDLLTTHTATQFVSALVARPSGTFDAIPLQATDPASGTPHSIPSGDHSKYGPHVTQVLDVNGDGAQDFIQFVNGELHVYVAKVVPPDYLKRVEQVDGQSEVEIGYVSGIDHQVVGLFPVQTTFPQVDGTGRGLWVAHRVTLRNGAGGTALTETHRYRRPMADVNDGWLGFATHEVRRPDATTTYQFDQVRGTVAGVAYPTLGLPISTTTQSEFDTSGHALIATTGTTYQTTDGQVPGKTIRVLKIRENEAHEQATAGMPFAVALELSATTFQDFDTFGNPKTEITTVHDLGAGSLVHKLERSSKYDNFVAGSAWMIGLEKDVCMTAHDALGRSERRCSTTSYDPSTGAPATQTIEPNHNRYRLEETFVLDAYGNVADVETRDATGRLRTDHWVYDDDSVYPTDYTNALGYTESNEIQLGFGLPLAFTDSNNVTIRRQVDGFGRDKVVTHPGGESVKSQLSAGGSHAALGVATILTRSSASASGREKTYYDGLGRVLFHDVTDINQHVQRRENSYDPTSGWLTSQTGPETIPAVPGQDVPSTVYTRDVMGRPLQINDSGAITHYAYDGALETITDPVGHATLVHQGALGVRAIERLDSQKDPVVTRYEYGPFGLPTEITQIARNGTKQASSYAYDVLGRVFRTTDESGITTETAYSPFGDIDSTTETDRSGAILATVTSTYDKIGRVLTTSDGQGTFNNVYTYDTAPHGIGRLATATSLDGVLSSFGYDSLSRPSSETTTYRGESYTFSNTYDAFGRLRTLSFPSPPGTTATRLIIDYDPVVGVARRLRSPSVRGKVVWTLRDVDEQGRITKAVLGNGLMEGAAFDIFGRPSALHTDTGAGMRVRDVTYGYYPNGNMRWRRDHLAGTDESFTHDFLNRLGTQTLSLSDIKAYQDTQLYDDFGNIENRARSTESLKYAYNTGAAPHGDNAVTELSSVSREMHYEYDARGNQTRAYGMDNDTGALRQAPSRTVKYTGFNLPRKMTTSEWDAGAYVTTQTLYVYDAFNRLFAREIPATGELVVERGTAFHRTRLSGRDTWESIFRAPTGLVASISTDGTTGRSTASYLHTDAFGSLDATSDVSGNVIERRSYTPFGEVRSATLGFGANPLTTGFTEARHGKQWLIDMNARLYDALGARFLSKDPVNADSTDSQSFNGYSYVLNIPLAHTDSSGMQVDQDWSDAHGGGTTVLSIPAEMGDNLDPIPVLPPKQANPDPSAIDPHASDAEIAIAPATADDQVIEANDSALLSNEPAEVTASLFASIRESISEAATAVSDFAVDYGPVAQEFAFQTAMTVGDFAGTAIMVVLTVGPNGCHCTLPQAQNQVDAFGKRQQGRADSFQIVQAQAVGAREARLLPQGNVIPRLTQGNKRMGFDHVVRQHWWSTKGGRPSIFYRMTINDFRALIDRAARSGAKWEPEGTGRVLKANMGRNIGTSGGNPTSWLKIVINQADEVVTAHPIPAP